MDTGDGTQSTVVLAPSEEQREQELLLPEEADPRELLLPEKETSDDGTLEDLIGVSADEPDDVDELKVSGTEGSKESPVVGGLSEVSGVTITEIIAGADVKAKGIRMPSEIGMFVDTGRPPGRLLGG